MCKLSGEIMGTYTTQETKDLENYGASSETYTAVLEYSGQIVKLEITKRLELILQEIELVYNCTSAFDFEEVR